jgi:hypothetical protein
MSEQQGNAAGTAAPETHRPEPWGVAPQAINPENYSNLIDRDGKFIMLGRKADIRRVCACVNFCQGIETEVLESMAEGEPVDGSVFIDGVESSIKLRLARSRDLIAMPTLLIGATDEESKRFESGNPIEVTTTADAMRRFVQHNGGEIKVSPHAAIGGAL